MQRKHQLCRNSDSAALTKRWAEEDKTFLTYYTVCTCMKDQPGSAKLAAKQHSREKRRSAILQWTLISVEIQITNYPASQRINHLSAIKSAIVRQLHFPQSQRRKEILPQSLHLSSQICRVPTKVAERYLVVSQKKGKNTTAKRGGFMSKSNHEIPTPCPSLWT